MMEACCSRFTAAEGGARLAAAASTKNILAVEYSSFIPVRLLYEKAYQIRGAFSAGNKRSIYITRASRIPVVAYELKILTDLATGSAEKSDEIEDWEDELEAKEVLVCTSPVLKQILAEDLLTIDSINVLIIDSCHLIYTDDNLKYIMQQYKLCQPADRPIILAMTYPLFASPKKENKKEIPTVESQEIISINTQSEIMRCQGSEEDLGVYENLDDFDLYEKLEWKIEELESELCCQMDLAEDIDGGKRIANTLTKPRELIIEHGPRPSEQDMSEEYKELEKFMVNTINEAMEFIDDHRHDPTEIYGEELYEEFMNIPDPGIDPKRLFRQFLYVLEQLGPYAADKAAFSLLTKLEKLKIKVPYERHFLLLCLCTTVFIKIRGYADYMFSKFENDWEKIKTFSAPKVLRFAEILEKFEPPEIKNASKKDISDAKQISGISDADSKHISETDSLSKEDSTKKMLNDIDKCDFTSLGDKIQDKVNLYETDLKEIEDLPTSNIDNTAKNNNEIENNSTNTITTVAIRDNFTDSQQDSKTDIANTDISKTDIANTDISKTDIANPDISKPDMLQRGLLLLPRRTGHRTRGRSRIQRNNAARALQMQQNPDALCGIVYMKDALIAKIMFMIIVDMSRCNRHLSYLCAQYCATDSPADPGTELKECQRQGKKQEEVLKKFRMHECNLLLATSALEEGIDLPRCNLVLRWDVPPSYRSYGLCRGRARAARATAALLCTDSAESTDKLLHNVATYRELDQIISRKCGCGIQDEPPQSEEDHADSLNIFVKPYTPSDSDSTESTNIKNVNTNTANKDSERISEPDSQTIVADIDSKIDTDDKDSLDNIGELKHDRNDNEKESKDINDKIDVKEAKCKTKDRKKICNVLEASIKEKAEKDSHVDSNYDSKNDSQVAISDTDSNNYDKDIDEISKKTSDISLKDGMKDLEKWEICDLNVSYKRSGVAEENGAKNELNRQLNEISENDSNKNNEINNILSQTHEEDAKNIEKLTENIPNITILDKQIKEMENISKSDSGISKNDNKNVLCNKCSDIKSSECACAAKDSVIKSDISKSDSKKNVSDSDSASVDLSTAIALINRYCGKLPSDTFTRLAPQWWTEEVQLPVPGSGEKKTAYICTLRLPLNCPVKYNIVGHPMPTRVLARRMVALQACRILHKSGELDNQLMPIGKENFKAAELETANTVACLNNDVTDNSDNARPGTTKRRQYYYKRTAWAFTDCQPVVDTSDSEIDPPSRPQQAKAETQPEKQTETQPEIQSETQPEKQAETQPEIQSETQPEKQSEIQPEIQSETQPETQSETQPEIQSETQPEIQTEETSNEESGEERMNEKNTGKKRNMLYAIVSKLWCALPERYNTRGRRLHAPQSAAQAIGILMAREEPDSLQIPAFPVYTRSGEVRVSVEHVPDADVRLSPRRGRLVRRFMRFVFSEVLRVRRRGMKLQSDGSTHNNYYIVPTVKTTKPDGTSKIDIDWAFLELIYQHTEEKKISQVENTILWQPQQEEQPAKPKGPRERRGKIKKMDNPLLKPGETFVFDADKYREAVVTPWYRNQDQPQFFLVAEICWNLTPDSSFPSASHTSFRDYYGSKYGVTLTQRDQPLLDVDHTSARLNLLTPRYVNRKGVALPVSSERTRRAKRDRLDQKQILVPELCRVHPFAAPLWFATVALPCVLYRINALLIADEIRRAVAIDVGLGIPKINEQTMPGFQWPALDFGWSLAEVLSADSEKNEKKKEEEELKREIREKEMREKEEKEKLEKQAKEKEKQQQQESSAKKDAESKEKTINDILQEKEEAEGGFEIGTWSNEMASQIPEDSEFDEFLEPLPPNLTFCTSASGGTNWCDPIEKPKFNSQFQPTRMYSMVDSDCSYISSDLDSDDTDLDFEGSDDDTDTGGFCCNRNTNMAMGVRIEYKTAHEAEAVDVERRKKICPAPAPDEEDDAADKQQHQTLVCTGVAPAQYIEKFRASVNSHKADIKAKGHLVTVDQPLQEILPEHKNRHQMLKGTLHESPIQELFPFGAPQLREGRAIRLYDIERNKRVLLEELKKSLPPEQISKMHCFSMKDIDIDSPDYINEKIANVGFDSRDGYIHKCNNKSGFPPYFAETQSGHFHFDHQPLLEAHPGPSPSLVLQALTMSNANDGINLERLETIGDSFLKFAITAYLYCAHPTVHEGKLSHMRSKQVSNLNLYRLGRNKRLGARMIASKFEPHDNWLPPCHKPPPTLHPSAHGDALDMLNPDIPLDAAGCFIPYNLITQHSIPDKSIADCVEALIGAYLLECGPRGALLFMSWLGIKVLPCHHVPLEPDHPYVVAANNTQQRKNSPPPSSPKRQRSASSSSECSSDDEEPLHHQEAFPEHDWSWPGRAVGSLQPYRDENGVWMQPIFGELKAPPSPLLRYIEDPEGELEQMLSGYDALERTLQYRFKDRSLLLQALTHASHHNNRLTDCYQRLEFLGDAILDYLITRHLYEDPRRHSPGALTDLRSALVNNTIFATLAARHGFHKYFRHMSPGLNEVLTKYVKIQEENGHSISEEHYLIQEDEMEQAEDVEVPKALGDLFESVAGAIFLDSGMSLGAVWRSYVTLMGAELEAFSAAAPKSPVRELLEAEPDTAKFGKPERLADGRRVRVCVEVFGRGTFKGVGRNYRIAKGTAARCALRHLRVHRSH